MKLYDRVITFGTFDLFHVGHLRIINRAKLLGNYLVVGVSTDALNYAKKTQYPIYTESDRMEIVQSLKAVDEVFLERRLEDKADYISHYNASLLVMGDDWYGKFDWCKGKCDVIYLPRTPNISSTEIKIDVIDRSRPLTDV